MSKPFNNKNITNITPIYDDPIREFTFNYKELSLFTKKQVDINKLAELSYMTVYNNKTNDKYLLHKSMPFLKYIDNGTELCLEENEKYSYLIDRPEGSYDEFINDITCKIEEKISNNSLNENELKVGYALIDILKNWESIFNETSGSSDKFNKNKVLSHIRDYTLLSTKDIRISMKKYKEIYGNKLKNGVLIGIKFEKYENNKVNNKLYSIFIGGKMKIIQIQQPLIMIQQQHLNLIFCVNKF